jgi:hypothetical protein
LLGMTMKKPDSPTKISLLSPLCCALALNGCTRDDSPGSGDAWSCNLPPRVDAEGVTQWSWRLQWWGNGDLAAACASYGAEAKMVMEVDVPTNPRASSTLPDCTTDEVLSGATRACAIAGAYRFEADCAAGELRFELPSENTFHGYYHIEGAAVVETMRHLLGQNVECSRQVFTRTGVSAAPPAPDAGAPGPDVSDANACPVTYPDPGCGAEAKPVCAPDASAAIAIYYCGCDGRTIVGGYEGPRAPYQFKGCCAGSALPGSVACPWDADVIPDGVASTVDGGSSPIDSQACTFDGSGLPGSFDDCVAAGGKLWNAAGSTDTFCVLTSTPNYVQCQAAGGYVVTWDRYCPDTGMTGGTVCEMYYPEEGCPSGRLPKGYGWTMPSCP